MIYRKRFAITGSAHGPVVFREGIDSPFLVPSALFKAIDGPLNLTLGAGGGSASAAQMWVWLAKEGKYYEKNGLSVEVISIPGSSLAIQAMLSGELPIIQAGGAGPIQAALSGTDTVIIATIGRFMLILRKKLNRR